MVSIAMETTTVDTHGAVGASDGNARYDAIFREIAASRDGAHGVWSYQACDYINATYFDGRLPTPLILWTLTPYAGCIGLTRFATPPFIALHPGLLSIADDQGGTKDRNWGIPRAWLGVAYAYDVLLHECIHVAVHSLHEEGDGCGPGWKGATSHNNPHWLAEVNRLAAPLGLDIVAGRNKLQRVPIEGKPVGPRGKPPTRVVRTTTGNVSYNAVARFPNGVRTELGLTDWYTRNALPFPHALE